MNDRFARVDEQFARVDEQFGRVEEQFGRVDDGFTGIGASSMLPPQVKSTSPNCYSN